VVLLVVLYALARRNPPLPRGSYFSYFLIGYGIFRIGVEFVRQPDIQVGYLFGTDWVTMGMLLSLPMVIGGVVLLVVASRWGLPQIGLEWQAQPAADVDGDEGELGKLESEALEGEGGELGGEELEGEVGESEAASEDAPEGTSDSQ